MLFYTLYNLALKMSNNNGMSHYTACIFMSLLIFANLYVVLHIFYGLAPGMPNPDLLAIAVIFPVHLTVCHTYIDTEKYIDIILKYNAIKTDRQTVLKKTIVLAYIVISLILPIVIQL
ncbi:hypothetical protein [Sinomicrobium sp.]